MASCRYELNILCLDAGSRQLFERKSSTAESSKQAPLPSVNTKKAVRTGTQETVLEAAVKAENGSAEAVETSPKMSPFQVHNKATASASGQSHLQACLGRFHQLAS